MSLHKRYAANMGFGVIGAGRCYLHLQQHGSFCSGRTNTGEHLFLSCTSTTHQLRFRADVFQIPQQRQALFVVGNVYETSSSFHHPFLFALLYNEETRTCGQF